MLPRPRAEHLGHVPIAPNRWERRSLFFTSDYALRGPRANQRTDTTDSVNLSRKAIGEPALQLAVRGGRDVLAVVARGTMPTLRASLVLLIHGSGSGSGSSSKAMDPRSQPAAPLRGKSFIPRISGVLANSKLMHCCRAYFRMDRNTSFGLRRWTNPPCRFRLSQPGSSPNQGTAAVFFYIYFLPYRIQHSCGLGCRM